jgi:hypothetical protein
MIVVISSALDGWVPINFQQDLYPPICYIHESTPNPTQPVAPVGNGYPNKVRSGYIRSKLRSAPVSSGRAD